MSRNKKSLAVACLLASICGKAGAMDSTKKINPASRSVSTGMSPVLKKVLIPCARSKSPVFRREALA
ncbi:MAG: hypothetical protein J6P21_00490 [Clostridia bacterium]|nr:hypothetical protein [Clostridia bacterium]